MNTPYAKGATASSQQQSPSPFQSAVEVLATPLSQTLRTFTAECHELLHMLDQPVTTSHRGPSDPKPLPVPPPQSNRSPTAAETPLTAPETWKVNNESPQADGSTCSLALAWSQFLLDSRMTQLERIVRYSAAGQLVQTQLRETARVADQAREGIRALTSPVLNDYKNRKYHCTVVSNCLSEVIRREDEIFGALLSTADAVATVHAEHGDSADRGTDAYRGELRRTAFLLEDLRTENIALHRELAGVERKRQKTKRHLEREREEKRNIGRRFDAVASENAALHRRAQLIEVECDAGAPTHPISFVSQADHRSALDAMREEYDRLKSQLDRQMRGVQRLRAELLASEREKDSLRHSITQMRKSLLRHRSVIELVTRRSVDTVDGEDCSAMAPQMEENLISGEGVGEEIERSSAL